MFNINLADIDNVSDVSDSEIEKEYLELIKNENDNVSMLFIYSV